MIEASYPQMLPLYCILKEFDMPTNKLIHQYNDFSSFTFSVIPHGHYVEVEAYELLSNKDTELEWQDKNASSHPVFTNKFEDALLVFSVTVKWDECADWKFSESYKHTCDVEEIISYGNALKQAYDIGMKHIDN